METPINKSTQPTSGITVEYGKVKVEKIAYNELSKKWQAEISQEINTIYGNDPSKTHHDFLMSPATKTKYPSKRRVWLEVEEGSTVAQKQAFLDSKENVRIIAKYSCYPILSENDISAIQNGLTTLEIKARGQMIKLEDRAIVPYIREQVNTETGEVTKVKVAQFRVNSLTQGGKCDIDARKNSQVYTNATITRLLLEDEIAQKAKIENNSVVTLPNGQYATEEISMTAK